jgi:hypothetical protein
VLLLSISILIPKTAEEASPAPADSSSQQATLYRAPIIRTAFHQSGGKPTGNDCIGDGATCVGYINGTKGEVDVTNNTNPYAYWRFKLTCLYGGDQYGGENPPSAGTAKSYLSCNSGAPAQSWSVLVDHIP